MSVEDVMAKEKKDFPPRCIISLQRFAKPHDDLICSTLITLNI